MDPISLNHLILVPPQDMVSVLTLIQIVMRLSKPLFLSLIR